MQENNYKWSFWALLIIFVVLVGLLLYFNAAKDVKIKDFEKQNIELNNTPEQVLRATVVDSFEDIVVVRLPNGEYWAFRNQKPQKTGDIVYVMVWETEDYTKYEILGYVAAPISDIEFTLATITTMRDVDGGRLYTVVDKHNQTIEIYSREIYASNSTVVVIRIKNKLYIGGLYE